MMFYCVYRANDTGNVGPETLGGPDAKGTCSELLKVIYIHAESDSYN